MRKRVVRTGALGWLAGRATRARGQRPGELLVERAHGRGGAGERNRCHHLTVAGLASRRSVTSLSIVDMRQK